jgi:hypothetical protein
VLDLGLVKRSPVVGQRTMRCQLDRQKKAVDGLLVEVEEDKVLRSDAKHTMSGEDGKTSQMLRWEILRIPGQG